MIRIPCGYQIPSHLNYFIPQSLHAGQFRTTNFKTKTHHQQEIKLVSQMIAKQYVITSRTSLSLSLLGDHLGDFKLTQAIFHSMYLYHKCFMNSQSYKVLHTVTSHTG